MAFLDSVTVPKSSGGFLGSITAAPKGFTAPPPTQAPAPQPSLLEKAIGYIKDSGVQALTFEKSLLTHPIKTITSVPDTFGGSIIDSAKNSFNQGTNAVENMISDYQHHTGSTAGDIANLLNVGLGTAGVLFSPVSGSFAAAQKYPIAKQLSDIAGIPGAVGSFIGSKAVDALPISQASKDVLMQPVSDVGSFAGSIFGFKVISKAKEYVSQGKPLTPEIATQIVEQTKGEHTEPSFLKSVVSPETVPERTITPPTGSGTSKVGASIEQGAIEKGLTESFGGTAGYDPITIKDQAAKVTDLIQRDPLQARAMALGDTPIPSDIRSSALLMGLEDHAMKTGDVQLLKDLAQSPLTSETSVHAQELRLLAERAPDSPVGLIRSIGDARVKSIEKRSGSIKTAVTKEVNNIKGEMKKTNTKQTWSDFVQEITCSY